MSHPKESYLTSYRDGAEYSLRLDSGEADELTYIPGLYVNNSVCRGRVDSVDCALRRLLVPGIEHTPVFADGTNFPNLRPYQQKGVERLIAGLELHGGAILADDMGLGKTLQSLTVAGYLGGRVLVVCPASVRETWREQVKKWTQLDCVVLGPPSEKFYKGDWQYAYQATVIIVSYNLAQKAYEAAFKGELPTTLIVDEAHLIRGRTTKYAKDVKRISSVCKYRLAITGTPQWDRPRDLFNLLDITLPKVFGNGYAFDYSYCDAKMNEWGGLENKGCTRSDELQRRLSYYMLRRTKNEVAKDMPPLTRNVVWISPTKEAERAYEIMMSREQQGDLQNALIATLEGKLEAAAELAIAARQFLLFTYTREHAWKLKELIRPEQPTVGVITGEMPSHKRRELVQWAIEHRGGLIATLDSLNAGVDGLQHVSSTGIFHSISWEPNKMAQAEARLHRIGQTLPVQWTYLAMRDSADVPVVRTVVRKLDALHSVMGGDTGIRDSLDSNVSGAGQDEDVLLAEIYASMKE